MQDVLFGLQFTEIHLAAYINFGYVTIHICMSDKTYLLRPPSPPTRFFRSSWKSSQHYLMTLPWWRHSCV